MNSCQSSGQSQTADQHDQQQEVRETGRKVDHLPQRGSASMRVEMEGKTYMNDEYTWSDDPVHAHVPFLMT